MRIVFDDDYDFSAEIVKKLVKVELTENQIEALICLIYNIGVSAFKNSSLLKKINEEASTESIKRSWLAWNKVKGKIVEGLTNRRKDEFDYYCK